MVINCIHSSFVMIVLLLDYSPVSSHSDNNAAITDHSTSTIPSATPNGHRIIGMSLNEPHTSESLENIPRTYVQQCHRICGTSQGLVNHSIFGCTYV